MANFFKSKKHIVITAAVTAVVAITSITAAVIVTRKSRQRREKINIVNDYLDLVLTNRASRANRYVYGRKDVIASSIEDFTSDQLTIYEAMLGEVEYEVAADGDAIILELTLPDVSAQGCTTIDEVIAGIGSDGASEETLEVTFEDDLSKNPTYDGNFVMEVRSAQAIADALVSVVADADLMPVYEEQVLLSLDDYMGQFDGSSGDAGSGPVDGSMDMFNYYMANIEYDAEVEEITEEGATVNMMGFAPDARGSIFDLSTRDSLIRMTAASLLVQINGGSVADRQQSVMIAVSSIMINGMSRRAPVTYEEQVEFTVDDSGVYVMVPESVPVPPLPSYETLDLGGADNGITRAALDYLLGEGLITQAQYDEFVSGYFGYDGIIGVVDSFIMSGASGDMDGLRECANLEVDLGAYEDVVMELMVPYFSNMEYDVTVESVDDAGATVLITGTAPDVPGIIDYMYEDDNLARIGAEYVYVIIGGGTQDEAESAAIAAAVAMASEEMINRETVTFEREAHLTPDADGRYVIDNGADMIPDVSGAFAITNIDQDSLMEIGSAALDVLLADGRISSAEYALYSVGLELMIGG